MIDQIKGRIRHFYILFVCLLFVFDDNWTIILHWFWGYFGFLNMTASSHQFAMLTKAITFTSAHPLEINTKKNKDNNKKWQLFHQNPTDWTQPSTSPRRTRRCLIGGSLSPWPGCTPPAGPHRCPRHHRSTAGSQRGPQPPPGAGPWSLARIHKQKRSLAGPCWSRERMPLRKMKKNVWKKKNIYFLIILNVLYINGDYFE